MHKQITVESIKQAVKDGAKSLTQIGIAHGYDKPVSGSVTAKIRTAVPNIADILEGKAPIDPVVVVKAKKVKAVKAPKTPKTPKVSRKRPYGGKVYGAVFAAALASGEVEFMPWVNKTAEKLGMTVDQVRIAANVMRTRNHQSNGGRSDDVSDKRGYMKLVALEQVEAQPAHDEVPVADVAAVASDAPVAEPVHQEVA